MSGDDEKLSATARLMKDTIMEQCAPKKSAAVVELDDDDEGKAVPKSKPRGSKSASSSQQPHPPSADDIMGAPADDETILDQVAARPKAETSVGMDEDAEYAALLKFFG